MNKKLTLEENAKAWLKKFNKQVDEYFEEIESKGLLDLVNESRIATGSRSGHQKWKCFADGCVEIGDRRLLTTPLCRNHYKEYKSILEEDFKRDGSSVVWLRD